MFIIEGFYYCHLQKVQFELIGIFGLFVWSVNYSSPTCKLCILFRTFRAMWTVLNYYRIFGTVLHRIINFNRQPIFSYFLLACFKITNMSGHVMSCSDMSIKYSDMSRSLNVIYIWGILTRFHLQEV